MRKTTLPLLLATLLPLVAGCDGGSDEDAGPPDGGARPAIVFSVDSMCNELLVNPVLEDYHLEIHK